MTFSIDYIDVVLKAEKRYRRIYEHYHAIPIRIVLLFVLILVYCNLTSVLSAENGYFSYIPVITQIGEESFSPMDTNPQSIFVCSDESVVVISRTIWRPDTYLLEYGATVVKLDPLGNQMWQYTFPDFGVRWLAGIDIDENDTVSFLASMHIGSSPDYVGYIVHVYTDGSVSRTQLDTDLSRASFNKALRTDSGDIIAVGTESVWVDLQQSYQRRIAFYRFSAMGEALTSAFFEPDSRVAGQTNAYDALIDESGSVFVGCRLDQSNNNILKLDIDGNVLDRISLAGNIPYILFTPVLMSHLPGSDHTVTVYSHYGEQPYYTTTFMNMASVTDTGITYLAFDSPLEIAMDSMFQTGNDLVFAGDNSIVRLSYFPTIDILWNWSNPQIYIGGGSNNTMTVSPSNCIYATGSVENTLAVVKLLPNGQVPVSDDYQVPSIHSISVYPNPMQDILNIKLNQSNSHETVRLSIYNIRGQLIREMQILNDTIGAASAIWDGKDMKGVCASSGIYFFRIEADGRSYTRRILKLK